MERIFIGLNMVRFLQKNIKLKNRIMIIFIISSIFLLAVIITSFNAFKSTSNEFFKFLEFNKDTQINIEITKNISQIQRQALIYIYEGHESSAEKVDSLYVDLLGKIDRPEAKKSNPNIILITQHLKKYHKTFIELKKQKTLRDRLIVDIRTSANKLEKKLKLYISNNKQNQLIAHKLLNNLLQIEKNAFRYFDSLDSSFIKMAKNSIKKIQLELNSLEKNDSNPQLKKIRTSINSYEKTFLEAVQRTRGYLFLINVVMAAEAYEILYNSNHLSIKLDNKSSIVQSNIINVIESTAQFLPISGALFLLILAIVSLILLKSIVNPIAALTKTFTKLAKNEDTSIPTYELEDELGNFTKAATVFKHTNAKTKSLLEKSQNLTIELEKKQMELTRSNEELEQFVYTVSHDLKSPLVTSMGFIGIIRKLADDGKYEEAISKLDKVASSNERMSQLISDLLDLSRVGRINFDKKDIDLNKMLHNLRDNLKNNLKKNNLNIIIKENLPTIIGNESRILQIFENVISNTIKYAKNQDGSILEIGSKEQKTSYLIYCKDNGSGIDKKYHEKIFALFYRLENSDNGTGIGLAIIQKIMKFHSGSVWVESEVGNGSTFWFRFPKKGVK